jgi:uncharacterized protein YndB with AHSA1/START domain
MTAPDERGTVIRDSFSVPAPPELVFHVLTDPDRISRWLPSSLSAEVLARDIVRISAASGAADFQRSAVPAELRLGWTRLDGAPMDADVRVEDSGGGGCTVDVTVRMAGEPVLEPQVRQLLRNGAERVCSDVEDNLTAG